MEQLPRLQARIANLHELRDLIRALRALAASHVQEAQGALDGIRRYVEAVEDAIAEGAGLLPKAAAAGLSDETGTASVGSVLIVACSEHGFVGGFNERLLDHALTVRQAGQRLVIVGRRGSQLAAERGLAAETGFPMATHAGGVLGIARQVAAGLATAASAQVVFGSYRRGGNYEPEARSILPLDPTLLARSDSRSPPLHHLAPAVLLQQLASEYLFAEITRALMESLASENGARLRVMESADHNIADKLEELQRSEHSLRQDAITEELLDVVIGSEAILADSPGL